MSDFVPMTTAQMAAAITPAMAAQMASMITPAMAGMMTPEHQAQVKVMHQEMVQAMQLTTARLPVDDAGKSFTKDAACVVKQPVGVPPTLPTALVGASTTVISTAGERVRVRYINGEEREFHKSELGVK